MATFGEVFNDYMTRKTAFYNALRLENQMSYRVKEEALSLAYKCDSWLLAMTSDFELKCGFDSATRTQLSKMLNSFPSNFETLRGATSPLVYCGICEKYVYPEKFWVCCKACWKLFHGGCLALTADHNIERHKCPLCNRGILSDLDSDVNISIQRGGDKSPTGSEDVQVICTCKGDVSIAPEDTISCADCERVFHIVCVVKSADKVFKCRPCNKEEITNFIGKITALHKMQMEENSNLNTSPMLSAKSQSMSEEITEQAGCSQQAEEQRVILCDGSFWRYCTVCKIWVLDDSADHEIKQYLCPSCKAKKCGLCGKIIASDEFWISCTVCGEIYHRECVTSSVDHIKQYKCPSCNAKRTNLKGLHCGECDKNADFWVTCVICSERFHGKCVNITPTEDHKIRGYKCPNCENARGYRRSPMIKRVSEL